MKAAGDGAEDPTTCEDNGMEQTSALQLFSNDGRRQHKFPAEVVARSMPVLRALRRAREHCDVALLATDGTEIWAHRFVLAARYTGCSALFSGCKWSMGSVFEPMPAQQDIVWPHVSKFVVDDLSSEMLELIIDLAYHVPLHERIGLHNVGEVLDVATALNITNVREHCLQMLGDNLEAENCIGTYQLALRKGYVQLSIDSFHYILRNFNKVWTTSSEFQSLTPDELRSVLYADELHAQNEVECVFGAILKWIAGNVEGRRGQLARLLPLIRFAFCSRADIEKVANDPLVSASEEAFQVMILIRRSLSQEPIDDVYGVARPDLSERRWFRPRVPKDILFMFGGWTGGATNHLVTYNCRSNRWLIQPRQYTPPRAYHGVATLDGLIYFIGGFDGRECYHTVVCLDVSQLKWTARANMQEVRCYVSVAVLQGYIYAMGGFNGEGRMSSCERYDSRRNQWEFIAPMHAVRSDACAAAAAGRIYVMGGFTGLEVLDTVECYDPSTDAWSHVVSMSSPRSGLKAVVHDDVIYVIGGYDGAVRLESAERLDARRGHWSELPSMNFARSNFVAAILEGSIYVAGGFNDGTTVSFVERYDIQARQWHRAPDLYIACSAAAACVYEDVPEARHWL